MELLGSLYVGGVGLLRGVEIAEMVLDVTDTEPCPPPLLRLKEADALKAARPVGVGASVADVLTASSQSKVVPCIVGAAAVNVVDVVGAWVSTSNQLPDQPVG